MSAAGVARETGSTPGSSSPPQRGSIRFRLVFSRWIIPSPSQRWFADVVIGQRPYSDREAGHASFHFIEFTGGDDILIALRQHRSDFFLGPPNPVTGHGMARKQPDDKVTILLLVDGDSLKKVDESQWIIAGSVLIFQSEQIGFTLFVASELEKRHRHGDVSNLVNDDPCRSADGCQGQ